MDFWSPIYLTLKLATVTTIILVALGIPTALLLSRCKHSIRSPIESLITLPLILPPSVLGFYLLIALSSQGPLEGMYRLFGIEPLAFTFGGLVLGSVFYSLPFAIQPMINSFSEVGEMPSMVGASLRAGPLKRFFTIHLPLAKRGILTGTVMAFAHTVGEFGVVLLIGGNIPGQTRLISIAIYDQVETLNFTQAHQLSGLLLAFSFVVLLAVSLINRPGRPI